MLRVRTLFTGVDGSPYYSNLYFPGTLSTDAQSRADAVRTFWFGLTTLLRTPMLATIDPFVPVISESTGEVTGGFTVTPPAQVGFTSTGAAMPPANQMLIRLSTPTYFAGRRLKGKLYIPGLTENTNDPGGVVSPTDRGTVLTALAPLLTGANRLGVWSRKNGAFVQVDGASAWEKWAMLRSRRD